MKNINKPTNAIVLCCLFLGAAVLPIIYSLLKQINIYLSLGHLLLVVIPSILIYLVCGWISIKKWYELNKLKKAILIGIALQAYLLIFISILQEVLIGITVSHYMPYMMYILHIFLSPIEFLYQKYIISQRIINSELGTGMITYHWEAGLILPLLRLAYSGIIGGFIGNYIEAKKA